MVGRHSSSQCAVSSTRKGAAKRSRFSLFIFKSRTRLLQEQERRAKLETIKAELLATGEVHSANFYIKTPRGWRIVSVLQEISQNIGLFSEIHHPTSFSVHYAASVVISIGGGKFSSFVPLLIVRRAIANADWNTFTHRTRRIFAVENAPNTSGSGWTLKKAKYCRHSRLRPEFDGPARGSAAVDQRGIYEARCCDSGHAHFRAEADADGQVRRRGLQHRVSPGGPGR